MPAVESYFDCALDSTLSATAAGATVRVRDRESRSVLCEVRLTRDDLRDLLERADLMHRYAVSE